MIHIVLDTETTGLSKSEDRIVEIGCVELENYLPTGRRYHVYCNPKKAMPREAERIHGLSDDFLRDKPIFRQIVHDFLEFIGDKELVIHNAAFDMGMLNSELARLNRPPIKNSVIDTMVESRKARPGKSHKLDAICRDYKIDLSRRTLHGALLDAEILSAAFLALRGGVQYSMGLLGEGRDVRVASGSPVLVPDVPVRSFRSRITPDELLAHGRFVEDLKKVSKELPIWHSYEMYGTEDSP